MVPPQMRGDHSPEHMMVASEAVHVVWVDAYSSDNVTIIAISSLCPILVCGHVGVDKADLRVPDPNANCNAALVCRNARYARCLDAFLDTVDSSTDVITSKQKEPTKEGREQIIQQSGKALN